MKKNLIFSALALVAVWAVWLIACAVMKNEYLLPSFWETVKACGGLFTEGAFWRAFGGTLLRTLLSFLVSAVLGVGLAALAVLFSGVRAFLAPVISILRTVPTMAVILLLLLWTSPSAAPVIVSFLVLFPAVYAAALASFSAAEEEYGVLTKAYRVRRGRMIFRMYLPLSAPSLLFQAGGIASMGLKITVSGEVLSNTYQSLGGVMQEAKMFLETPRLLALTLLAVLFGFLLEGIFFLVSKLACGGGKCG